MQCLKCSGYEIQLCNRIKCENETPFWPFQSLSIVILSKKKMVNNLNLNKSWSSLCLQIAQNLIVNFSKVNHQIVTK